MNLNTRRRSTDELEECLNANLEHFLRDWGPVKWAAQAASIPSTEIPELAHLLHGLSGIEDDSFYMQKKLRHSGAARLQAVKHFNSVWLVEEAEHARALAALSVRFGGAGAVEREQHSTFSRDPRSILAVPALSAARLYPRGILAAYMTLGVLVEFIAIQTYNAIPRLYPYEPMKDVLSQMARQESRHLRFYRRGAVAILENDPKAQAFVRYVVNRYWRPPGVDLFGREEWLNIFGPVLNDPESLQDYARLDDLLQTIPGMTGLSPMAEFLASASISTLPVAVSAEGQPAA